MAGVVIRALAWLGPHEIEDGLDTVLPRLTQEDLDELATARAVMPRWMAEPLSARLAHECFFRENDSTGLRIDYEAVVSGCDRFR